ncbi:MAG: hydrogen gas-evolving membrane-bound hydrogenase subunit E [Acidimicrobiales bacterium]
MTPAQRKRVFVVGIAGLLAFYLWGLVGLPGFGHYPGPYGDILNAISVSRTHATGVVSAVNFDFRGFDTLGEEYILFMAATGVATVLRRLRAERDRSPVDEAAGRKASGTSDAARICALVMTGPTIVFGWYLITHAQTSPSGGFQGGVVLAGAFVLLYLAGEYLTFRRVGPVKLTDAVEAIGAGSFAAIGVGSLVTGAAFLSDVLPLGHSPGAIDSSGTIALISFFVGVEVTAAFLLIVSELLEQTLLIRGAPR